MTPKRHAKHAMILAAVGTLMVGISLPVGASATEQDTGAAVLCSSTMPSCAPKPAWVCIHPGVTINGMCDPDSEGCLDTE